MKIENGLYDVSSDESNKGRKVGEDEPLVSTKLHSEPSLASLTASCGALNADRAEPDFGCAFAAGEARCVEVEGVSGWVVLAWREFSREHALHVLLFADHIERACRKATVEEGIVYQYFECGEGALAECRRWFGA